MNNLKNVILEAVPSAVVDGKVGRRTSFEVSVNGVLIFSKIACGSFPDFTEVAKVVAEVAAGGQPRDVPIPESKGMLNWLLGK